MTDRHDLVARASGAGLHPPPSDPIRRKDSCPSPRRRRLAITLAVGLLAGLIPQAASAAAPSLATAEIAASGRLWVGMGDANQPNLAQNRNSLDGKILRMNREGGRLNGAVEARLRLVATP